MRISDWSSDVCSSDLSIAFFWFPNAPEAAPGISAPEALPTRGNFMSAHGSMNHIAINVRADKFDEYYQRLVDKGVDVTPILNHDNSPTQSSAEMHDDVYEIGRASCRERGLQYV